MLDRVQCILLLWIIAGLTFAGCDLPKPEPTYKKLTMWENGQVKVFVGQTVSLNKTGSVSYIRKDGKFMQFYGKFMVEDVSSSTYATFGKTAEKQ